MQGAGRAIGWELLRHHRLALGLCGTYLAGFWTIKAFVLGPEYELRLRPPNELSAFVTVPITFTYFYFVGLFSYGLSGDLVARESVFPRRMFTLPVSTLALAGWPMLYGSLSCAALWLLTALLARWPGGTTDLPWIWPTLLLVAFLAWMQALTWLAYPLRGLRVVVAVILLVSIDSVVILALHFNATEAMMIAILAPQIVAAYAVGYFAVARARSGQVPHWNWAPAYAGATRLAAPFSSASQAQAWLEWRRHGRTLPMMVFWVVPWELLLLFLPGNDTEGMIFAIIFIVAITPPVMATMAAPALSTLTTFAATRPLTTVGLVRAKLEMTILSTLAAWLLTIVFMLAALWFCGAMPVIVKRMQIFGEIAGPMRAAALTLLVLAALVASTWKNLVLSLAIGLTGRQWLIKSSVIAAMMVLTVAFPTVHFLARNWPAQSIVWNAFPWILMGLVWLKIAGASWVAIKLHDHNVVSYRELIGSAVSWLVAVCVVYGLLEWIDWPFMPFYFIGSLAILLVPLLRLSAAPLALAWSRHR